MSYQRHYLSVRLFAFLATVYLSIFSGLLHAEEFQNFLGIKFKAVPAGSFLMGSPESSDVAYMNEFPQHKVNMPSFAISTTEITLGQFKRYIIATEQLNLVTDAFMAANAHSDKAPVVHVSWNDIKGFIFWLNKNKPTTDKGTYRLPSEAEWEYACRAGTDKPYCGGNTPSSVAWHAAISGSHQQAVARKNANAFGLYDMSGNALEWVEDCYHETYTDGPTDGSSWESKCDSNNRVLRGGSWKDRVRKIRANIRKNAPSVNRNSTLGFRLVRQL